MKISVITVCLNSERTIEKTLQSFCNQDYENKEYIVIDGLSTDSTMSIINNYKQKIDRLISESDKGIYDAINKGISLSSGEIICILHSNDIFFNNHVLSNVFEYFYNKQILFCKIF